MSWPPRGSGSDRVARSRIRAGFLLLAVLLHGVGLLALWGARRIPKTSENFATVVETIESPPPVVTQPPLERPKLAVSIVRVPEPIVQIEQPPSPAAITATMVTRVVEPKEAAAAAPKPVANPVAETYAALLSAHLAAIKQYPASARRARHQGEALVVVRLERSGKVIDWHLVASTGSEDLDAEVARMVNAADPFPPFPDSMPQARQSFSVPVSFTLQPPRRF